MTNNLFVQASELAAEAVIASFGIEHIGGSLSSKRYISLIWYTVMALWGQHACELYRQKHDVIRHRRISDAAR